MSMQFIKAERKKSKLRLVLSGVSGSGKTYGALKIAKGIGGKVAVIDTEHGSANLYSDLAEFDTLHLEAPYSPERYIEAIKAAEEAGYDVLIIDSITHEWNGTGGVLEIVDAIGKAKFKGNNWAAWSEGTPRHRKFVETMLGSNMHIIATIRTKAAYVESEENGRKKITKMGTQPEQRDGMEYEFTTMLELSRDGNFAVASKDRTRLFSDPQVISEETGKKLVEWLETGKDERPELMEQIKGLMKQLDKPWTKKSEEFFKTKSINDLKNFHSVLANELKVKIENEKSKPASTDGHEASCEIHQGKNCTCIPVVQTENAEAKA